MSLEAANAIGGAIVFLILAAILILAHSVKERRLSDPDDTEVILIDKVIEIAKMNAAGRYRVTTYRQSGNIHRAEEVTGSASGVVNYALMPLRRARIDAVVVRYNDHDGLALARLHRNHRGASEGKKIGAVAISLLEPDGGNPGH
jgi:hypothetical protein